MTQDEMESLLREIFNRVDQDESSSAVARLAFMEAIRDADLGFTRREVNILMAEAPISETDTSGPCVAHQDFIPICFPVLMETFAAGVVELPSDQDGLTQFLLEVFASGDADATGLLTVADLARLLRAADIGLTRLQIVIAMAEAQEDKSGFVYYEKFAAHVAGMLLVLMHLDAQPALASYVLQYRQSGEFYTVLDMNQHAFEQTLARALEAADEDRRGLLAREEISEALTNALPEINQRQLRALLALAEPNEMGEREYALIAHSAFQALQKLQEYDRMIMES
jgi:Ca2+-binding EF-hand superfamily protein